MVEICKVVYLIDLIDFQNLRFEIIMILVDKINFNIYYYNLLLRKNDNENLEDYGQLYLFVV